MPSISLRRENNSILKTYPRPASSVSYLPRPRPSTARCPCPGCCISRHPVLRSPGGTPLAEPPSARRAQSPKGGRISFSRDTKGQRGRRRGYSRCSASPTRVPGHTLQKPLIGPGQFKGIAAVFPGLSAEQRHPEDEEDIGQKQDNLHCFSRFVFFHLHGTVPFRSLRNIAHIHRTRQSITR